jgi:hypothetical protein
MADYALVEWTLDTLAANYTPGNVATSTPVLVDDADRTTYAIDTDTGSRSAMQRRYDPDPGDTNIVSVSPSPDRQEQPIGTEFDLEVDDAVNIVIEGVHVGETGEIGDPDEFRQLKNEVRRALLAARVWPKRNPDGKTHYHTAVPQNAGRPPEDEQANYFAYTFDLGFRGYEELP